MSGTADVFAERLLQVIDDGRRTATYKLALLLALIDGCAAEVGDDGRAPEAVHTRTIARHVLRIYLPQVRVYLDGDGDPLQLRQITGQRKAVTNAVLRLHIAAQNNRCRTVGETGRRIPDEYERCLDEVERTFARYPVRLLQVVGREQRPFLYNIDWGESVTLAALHAPGGGLVRFRPDAGDNLLRLAPLLRPLIELHWTRMVARINRIDVQGERLHRHLFGAERTAFPVALRSGLADLQDGRCFYCGERLPRAAQVDHFMPWARWPNDAIENLVLADRCNGHKSDYLPALPHVMRWKQRLVGRADDLTVIAGAAKWETDARRSLALTRSAYAHVPAETPLWLRVDEFTYDDPAAITALLADLPIS